MAFDEKLRYLRKKNKISQEELATKLNVSRQAVSKWETGTLPDVDNLKKIGLFFDCSVDYLVNDEIIEPEKDEIRKGKAESCIRNVFQTESLLYFAMWGIVLIQFIIYVLSKFSGIRITRQNPYTGYWYVGYYAFLDKYRLFDFIFFMICAFVMLVLGYGIIKFRKYRNTCTNKKLKILLGAATILRVVAALIYYYIVFENQIITMPMLIATLVVIWGTLIIKIDIDIYNMEAKERTPRH